MAVIEHPLGGLIEGMLQGREMAMQLHRQMQADQAFKTQQALDEKRLTMQEIMNGEADRKSAIDFQNAGREVTNGMVTSPAVENLDPGLPGAGYGKPGGLSSYTRKADASRTVSDRFGNKREIYTPEEQQQRALDAQISGQDRLTQASTEAQFRNAQTTRKNQLALENGGVPANGLESVGIPAGYPLTRAEFTEYQQKALAQQKLRQDLVKGGYEKLGEGDTFQPIPGLGGVPGQAPAPGAIAGPDMPGIDTPGVESWLPGQSAPAVSGATPAAAATPATATRPTLTGAPKLSGDLEKVWLPAFALKHGLTAEALRKPENAALMMQGVTEYAQRTQDPAAKQMMQQLHQATLALAQERLSALQASRTTTPMQINPGTREFRIAQDLAYGKLPFNQFRSMFSGRTQEATNRKLDIYDKAAELNPNFNPAQFEMGFTFAKNPKVQQQLASMDNVTKGIDDLLKFSDLAKRSGVTMLNKLIVPGGIAVGGKTYSDFHTAQIAFADELSGALGFGGATDMSKQMGLDMTNANLSPENFRSAVENVIQPFVARKKKTLLDQMGVYGVPGMNPAAGQATAPAAGGTVQYTSNGQTYAIPAAQESEFLRDHPQAVKANGR